MDSLSSDRLKVDGAVEEPLELGFEDLSAFPDEAQVVDVSRFHPRRVGDGVTIEAILERVKPRNEANYLTLHAARDDFHVSVPLDDVRHQGVVVYRHNGKPLPVDQGGPIRFLIKDPSACHSSELDECANVKYLSRIELSVWKKRDTRPVDEASHVALHAAEAAKASTVVPPAQMFAELHREHDDR